MSGRRSRAADAVNECQHVQRPFAPDRVGERPRAEARVDRGKGVVAAASPGSSPAAPSSGPRRALRQILVPNRQHANRERCCAEAAAPFNWGPPPAAAGRGGGLATPGRAGARGTAAGQRRTSTCSPAPSVRRPGRQRCACETRLLLSSTGEAAADRAQCLHRRPEPGHARPQEDAAAGGREDLGGVVTPEASGFFGVKHLLGPHWPPRRPALAQRRRARCRRSRGGPGRRELPDCAALQSSRRRCRRVPPRG